MNNKLQAKDLIKSGTFHSPLFCTRMLCGNSDWLCSDISSDSWCIVDTDHRNSIYVIPDKGKEVWYGNADGNSRVGLLMGLTGMGYWGVPLGLIFGLLGDLILKFGNYKSAKRSLIGYAVFSLWMVGTYIPMYFMVEDSRASFAASFGKEYADKVMAVMPMWSIVLVIAGIFICAIIGGMIGKALLKKHFVKAGIV